MYISSRLLKVIDFLMKNCKTTIKEVAIGCSITERMVRYDIESLNFLLRISNLPEIEKQSKGNLIVPDEFISSDKVKDFKNLNKYSRDERIEYIKARLLIEGRVNLSSLAKELDVSRTSIRSDLSAIIEMIEDEYIKVVNNEVVSDERSIRHAVLKHFSKELLKLQNKNVTEEESILINYLRNQVINISQSRLREIIESIAKDMKNYNTNYFAPVWLNILVSYMRIKNENYREVISEDNILKDRESYKILLNYLDSLEKVLEVKYIETEILGLSKCIEGCMSNNINSYIYENWLDIVITIKKIINDASDYSGINLKNDEILVNGLLNHIKPAIYRIVKNITLEIDICMDVVEPYEELLHIVKRNFKTLEQLIQTEVSEYEIVLITLHMLASIERNKNKYGDCKNIILVCGGGYGTTSIVANRIRSNYNVNIVDMVAYCDFIDYDLSNIDYIISILKINENSYKEKPIIKISPFITEKDKVTLAKYLPKADLKKQKLKEILEIVNESTEIQNKDQILDYIEKAIVEKDKKKNHSKTLRDYIDISKVEIIDKVYSWQESILRSGELLERAKDIERDYINNIINTSEIYGVHFVLNNGIVIPHGEVDDHINNSAISILYIKEQVKFNYDRFGNLFFMIAAKTTKDHVKSIEEISKISNNVDFINSLKEVNNKEELMKLILDNIE